MKKILIGITVLSIVMTSCVSMEKYAALESKNDRLNKQYSITKDELAATNSENKRLLEQNKQLRGTISNNEKDIERLNDELKQLNAEYSAAKKKYEETTAAYMAQLTGKNNDLTSARLLLEENTDINVMVEGHTDNVAYRGKNEVKDNWDLSVMRATAIVKALLKNSNIAPNRITASGRGEYVPKVDNSTKENRAINRRTEIILTPKYVELLDILSK